MDNFRIDTPVCARIIGQVTSTFMIFSIYSFHSPSHSLRHRIRTVQIATVQLDVQTQVVYNQSAELSHRLYHIYNAIYSQRKIDHYRLLFFFSSIFRSLLQRSRLFVTPSCSILTQWHDVYARNINYPAVSKISSSCFQSIIKAWHKTPELRYKLFTGEQRRVSQRIMPEERTNARARAREFLSRVINEMLINNCHVR